LVDQNEQYLRLLDDLDLLVHERKVICTNIKNSKMKLKVVENKITALLANIDSIEKDILKEDCY